jgi:hypothetical protein
MVPTFADGSGMVWPQNIRSPDSSGMVRPLPVQKKMAQYVPCLYKQQWHGMVPTYIGRSGMVRSLLDRQQWHGGPNLYRQQWHKKYGRYLQTAVAWYSLYLYSMYRQQWHGMVPSYTDNSGMVSSLSVQTAVSWYGLYLYRQQWHEHLAATRKQQWYGMVPIYTEAVAQYGQCLYTRQGHCMIPI